MKKHKIVLTHPNKLFDQKHIAWSTIIITKKYIDNWLKENKLDNLFETELLDLNDFEANPDMIVDEIFVFQTGKVENEALRKVIKNAENSNLVLADPNWDTVIDLRYDRLITPFKNLNNLSGSEAVKKMVEIAPNFDFKQIPVDNYYLPLGYFALLYGNEYDNDCLSKETDEKLKKVQFTPKSENAYIGSLKVDRLDAFKYMMDKGVDFIGQFMKKSEIIKSQPEYSEDKVHLMGKVPAYLVKDVYKLYGKMYFAPDEKVLLLDDCLFRQIEFETGHALIVPVANEKTKDILFDTMKYFAKQIKPVSKDFEYGVWKFDRETFENHYLKDYNSEKLLLSTEEYVNENK